MQQVLANNRMSVKRECMFKVVVLGYRLFFIGLLFIVAATIGEDPYEDFLHLFAKNLYLMVHGAWKFGFTCLFFI